MWAGGLVCALGCLLGLSCVRTSGPPPSPTPGSVAAEDATPSEHVAADPQRLAAELAQQWCRRGGEAFRPPARAGQSADDDYPPRLSSCTDIVARERRRDGAGDLMATAFVLDAAGETRELLLLQTKKGAAVFELDHQLPDTSGDGATWHWEYLEVEVRDVTGTSTPEWIARIGVTGGDSYEADRCIATEDDQRSLVLCSETATGIACFDASYHATKQLQPREDLTECDVPRAELQATTSGYETTVEIRRDTIVFTPTPAQPDEPTPPPYAAEVPIQTLFQTAGVPPLAEP
jgi:hypothetical protein